MTDDADDLADLLGPPSGTPPAAMHERLLHQTERCLARDRWLRRGIGALSIAGLFVVGGAVGWFARPPRVFVPEPEVVVVPFVVPVVPPVADAPGSPAHILSARAAELQAEQTDDPNAAASLYRQAGDAFLREEDYANATRCYRLYLARAGETGLALTRDDSWLLVSLKNAAFKEKVHATPNDG